MITLTEKRLHELENRIPVFIAEIEQQHLKMQEMTKFPNELNALRHLCKDISMSIQAHISSSDQSKEGNNETHAATQKLLASQADEIKQLRSLIETLALNSQSSSKGLSEAQVELKNVVLKQNVNTSEVESLQKSTLSLWNALDKVEKAQDSFQGKLIGIQGNLASVILRADEYEEKISKLKLEFPELDSRITKVISEMKDNFRIDLDLLREKISQTTQNVDYSSQISEIKRDLSTVLGVVHVTASQSPDQDKVSAKMKTMENSIAQIYELLKKCESR